ncbi:MAG: PAS domain S-box protein, partial [Alphaproteobacteria bacterium]|nr:PAS domain S-box protein [Alphaproteobacteria bacterium]
MSEHPRISSDAYDKLLDTIGALVIFLDREGRVARFNTACERVTGYRESEVLRRTVWDFLVPDEEIEAVRSVFADLYSGKLPSEYQNHWVTKAGDRRFIAWSNTISRNADGSVDFVIGTGMDLTEKIRSESSLRDSEAILKSTFETSPNAIATIKPDGSIISFNPAAERLFGYSAREVVGQNVKILMPSPYHDEHDGYLARYLDTGEKRIIGIGREVTGRKKNGEQFPLDLAVGEVATGCDRIFTGFMRDLSERKRVEEAVRESDRRLQELQSEFTHVSRLSVMGEMATGLAHEINQPLATIMNYLQACNRMLEAQFGDETEEIRDFMVKASEQAYRAGQIIKRLRDFAARGETERLNDDINEVVREASTIALTGAVAAGIDVEFELADDLPEVLIDRIQIQQVLVNFVRNSLDAMFETGSGRLLIATAFGGKDEVVVSVSDEGPGIADKIAENLFLPFNTSKADGLGIGLSVCQSIIESHDGRIWAAPNEGR